LIERSLVRSCRSTSSAPSEILTVLQYIMKFVDGVDGISGPVRRPSRLCDYRRRCCMRGEDGSVP
jgi:hypothetical protein